MTPLPPAEIARRIAALGARTGPEVAGPSMQLFKPLHDTAPAVPQRVARDLSYGPHDRHRLDVHTPGASASDSAAPRPVVLFIHGGGFVKGDKTLPDSYAYGNVARWAVTRGYVVANMTYRLAPEHPWPSGGDDVGLAIAWLRAHIAQHGGDPQAIFLMGHSAGAAHAATWLTRAEAQGPALEGVAGCMLLSGGYDPALGTPRTEYYGTDAAAYPAQSTVSGLVRSKVPMLVAVAEYDPPEIARHTTRLLHAFGESGAALPRVVQVAGHNHYTTTHHLGTADERLGDALADFMSRHAHPHLATP